MKLQELPAGLIKSFPYALLNRAGEIPGRFFQLYLVIWMIWIAFFVSGGADSVVLIVNLQNFTYPGLPAFLLPAVICILTPYLPVYFFWIYDRTAGTRRRRKKEMQAYEAVKVDFSLPSGMEVGTGSAVSFQISNPTKSKIENIWIRTVFPESIRCDSPQVSLGVLKPGTSKSVSISFVPLSAGKMDLGLVDFYFEMKGKEFRKEPFSLGTHEIAHSYLDISTTVSGLLKFGHVTPVHITLKNDSLMPLTGLGVKCFFSRGIDSDSSRFTLEDIGPGSEGMLSFEIIPKIDHVASLGYFNLRFHLNGSECHIGPVDLGKHQIMVPKLDIRMNMPTAFYKDVPVSIGIVADNRSDDHLSNISFTSCFSSQLECEAPIVSIPEIEPGSSRYTSISMKPVTGGKIDLGNLNISFEVNGNLCYMEPIALGTYKVT